MIVYFSGTGNSRFAAEFLARQLGDELLVLINSDARLPANAPSEAAESAVSNTVRQFPQRKRKHPRPGLKMQQAGSKSTDFLRLINGFTIAVILNISCPLLQNRLRQNWF